MGRLRYLVFLALLVLPGAPGRADQRKDVERELRKQLKGNVLTLQKFYKGDWLRFDAQGNLRDPAEIGAWTLYAKLQVHSITLREEKLKIMGWRLFLAYDEDEQNFRHVRSRYRVQIELELPAGVLSLEELQAAMGRVFLTSSKQLADVLPSYWEHFFAHPGDKDCSRIEQPLAVGGKAARHDDPGIVGAELVPSSRRSPAYPRRARAGGIEGKLLVCAVITKEGEVNPLAVVNPLGFGLDDAAVEAIRDWKYEPARLGGKPVAVLTSITVTYSLKHR